MEDDHIIREARNGAAIRERMADISKRRAILKNRARLMAADVVGFTSAMGSGLFEDLTDQEISVVNDELRAISNRIRRTTLEASDV